MLEGGNEESTPAWRALLSPVHDDGFHMNSISVYGFNFAQAKEGAFASLERSLEAIGCRQARYLTFRFRKPLNACMEQSLYLSQVTKNKAYGLSYITVMGNQVPPSHLVYNYLLDIQKENSLEVLSKFFSSEFTEAFELISEQASIIEKIKGAFDKLAVLMNTKASLIKPIFLAICAKNQSLGDWIMQNRLISLDVSLIKKEQIGFLGDIISSNKDTQFDKVTKVKDFLLAQIKQSLSPEQHLLIARYLKLFNSKLRELALFRQEGEPQALAFEAADLNNVIGMMATATGKPLFNALTEFALVLLAPPRPFVNATIGVDEYVTKLLSVEDPGKQVQNLLFCSIMAAAEETAMQHILKLNKVEWVVSQLKQLNQAELFHYS